MRYLLKGLLWCILQAKEGVDDSARKEFQAGKLSPELQEIESKILRNQVTKELNYPIGLVYGGATKIKQYVFESDKLAAIRGASGILDRINLVDLPAFFGCEQSDLYPHCQEAKGYCQNLRSTWLERHFPGLAAVLIPELIIYSTGGNILAFCPYQHIDQLADAIEKRYTYETLTANSCAVGAVYKLYEIFLGLDNCDNINWQHPLIQANFPPGQEISKGFNQLTTQLAIRFNQRRAGNVLDNRPSRAYPPHFDTHPYIQRDTTEKRSAVIITQASLPAVSCLSEASARQFVTGQLLKRDDSYTQWYQQSELADWQPGITDDTTKPQKSILKSWVTKFTEFLSRHPEIEEKYYAGVDKSGVEEARSVQEIGNASNKYIAFIYADGNNMGGYIQNIQTPDQYQKFSRDVLQATEQSTYYALAQHLHPHRITGLTDREQRDRNNTTIHPFEIITIGGDDVLVITPANKALEIALTLCEQFEKELLKSSEYISQQRYDFAQIHRSRLREAISQQQCQLSISAGVLIIPQTTTIYYAQDLAQELLKSAKQKAKKLKERGYLGGTIDFFVMKSVTSIASSISEFRRNALEFSTPKRKLYGAPYTLIEIRALLQTIEALQQSKFPKSQLYQIRSLLEQSKQAAMLNYRYFRSRLSNAAAKNILVTDFEEVWCQPKDSQNKGNLAPWMTLAEENSERMTYETIWREIVNLYSIINGVDEGA